ncbi:hypothetical protein MRB53_032718 [Persea americana]|uniref:Uncharacterized protein n=1 Tax=Persea americana TaxID=3435 RepID=A0ACC2KTA2_PERAE|nr:hypothetical protein MRB53_032718 [Persea americana]
MPQGCRIKIWKRGKVFIPLRVPKIERRLGIEAAHNEIPHKRVLEEEEMMEKEFLEFAHRFGSSPARFKHGKGRRRRGRSTAMVLGVLRRWRE